MGTQLALALIDPWAAEGMAAKFAANPRAARLAVILADSKLLGYARTFHKVNQTAQTANNLLQTAKDVATLVSPTDSPAAKGCPARIDRSRSRLQ